MKLRSLCKVDKLSVKSQMNNYMSCNNLMIGSFEQTVFSLHLKCNCGKMCVYKLGLALST